ncbi:MAG: hypothetical protein CFE43_19420 [Burkholderiales bacterium PBB3]|nr:MAG: hypothetical protein CFE43_19420 [Burkholderiales bacterium PBB3]
MTNPLQRSARLPLVDALRAFALFGILQVNIQSFVWGLGEPLGFLLPTANGADTAAYLLVAALVASKFMALFAFLFGFGFALQMKSLGRSVNGKRIYRRRLWFLLAVGIAHGCLLYFGDVLAAYALCGFILLNYANDRPAALAHSARRWGIGFATFNIVVLGGLGLLDLIAAKRDLVVPISDEVWAHQAIYATGSYGAQLLIRIPEYFGGLLLGAVQYVPMVMTLFLLGALAARQGWLRYPERHPRVWRMASRVGTVGLVLACAGAALAYTTHTTSPGRIDFFAVLLSIAGLTTMALYVAWIVRYQNTPLVRNAILWLAPAGRMPLSNYLLQSLVMGALLSGWGLGWGATLARAELALLGLAIVLVQIVLSRLWMARFGTGPMETLWRRATYSRQ